MPLPWGVRIGLGEGGAAPLSLYLSHSFLPPSLFLVGLGKEGVLLPVGVGLPPLARPPWPAASSPLAPLYTGAGGTP